MRKIRLELDSLAVESFATLAPEAEAGTVRGRADLAIGDAFVPRDTSDGCGDIIVPATKAQTCPSTCAGPSCPGTCGGPDCSWLTTPCATCIY